MTVGRCKDFVRHDLRMRVAPALRDVARGEIGHDLAGVESHDGVEQREVDVLALTGALDVCDRRANSDARVHAGEDIGDRDADLHRAGADFAVALAGDAHQATHALEDEVVAGARRVGPVLTEPGDRAVDEAGIEWLEVFITQAIALERADFVVFDQHVALGR